MEFIKTALDLLFGANPELRGIIWLTLRMSLLSTFFSSLIGIPIGAWVGGSEFKGKGWVVRVLNTFMGIPPVVAGLVVYLLLSRSGPLGSLKLLFSVTAMVIAQVILITPIIASMTANVVSVKAESIRETCYGLGISNQKRMRLTMLEFRPAFIAIVLAGFARAIAEVGAVQMVGGNIQFKTRVMTTAIMMQSNMGYFELAVVLGVILLLISFIINTLVHRIQKAW
ncbi:MAG: ABC transporter permease [Anaerolineaceae bacterium]|jgi:tungstate transport system permease protein